MAMRYITILPYLQRGKYTHASLHCDNGGDPYGHPVESHVWDSSHRVHNIQGMEGQIAGSERRRER